MTFHGSCHCGAIAFEVEADSIPSVIRCNCSICRRRGHLLWFVPRATFTLETPESNASTYRFNTMKIAHRFCRCAAAARMRTGRTRTASRWPRSMCAAWTTSTWTA